MSDIERVIEFARDNDYIAGADERMSERAAAELASIRVEGAIRVNLLTKKDNEIISLKSALRQAREGFKKILDSEPAGEAPLRMWARYTVITTARHSLAAIDVVLEAKS